MKGVLITGGAGFIGSRVAARLVEAGVPVTILDNLSAQVHGASAEAGEAVVALRNRVRFVKGDVRIRADVSRALAGATHVLHLAAETGTGQSMYRIGQYTDVNVQGTSVLLECLQSGGSAVEQVVVASSRSVYGEGKNRCERHGPVVPNTRNVEAMAAGDFAAKCPLCAASVAPLPTDEDTPLRPVSVYGISKLAQELLVLCTCEALGVQAQALRYQNVYGPGQSLVNPYTGMLPIFASAILHGEEINVFEDGQESRDFVYVDDAVAATLAALQFRAPRCHAWNVGSGTGASVLKIIRELGVCFGKTPKYRISGEFRPGDIRHAIADLAQVTAELGFAPRTSLSAGIATFGAWVRDHLAATAQAPRTYRDSLFELRRTGFLKGPRGSRT